MHSLHLILEKRLMKFCPPKKIPPIFISLCKNQRGWENDWHRGHYFGMIIRGIIWKSNSLSEGMRTVKIISHYYSILAYIRPDHLLEALLGHKETTKYWSFNLLFFLIKGSCDLKFVFVHTVLKARKGKRKCWIMSTF